MKGLFRYAQVVRLWRAHGKKGGMRMLLEESSNRSKTGTNSGGPRFVRKKTTMRKALILGPGFCTAGRVHLWGKSCLHVEV